MTAGLAAALSKLHAASGACSGDGGGQELAWAVSGAWDEVCQAAPGLDEDALAGSLWTFYDRLSNVLLVLLQVETDPPPGWSDVAEACFATAASAGAALQDGASDARRSHVKDALVGFLERLGDLYDQLLAQAEHAEWEEGGSTGSLRLHMLHVLFVAFGADATARDLLGPGGLLALTGNDVQMAVSLAGFALRCSEAPSEVQIAAAHCLVDLTTADAVFLGAGIGAGSEPWEQGTGIAKLTTMLKRHVNQLIMALINYQVVDSFVACAKLRGDEPGVLGQVVRALMTTVHNCLLYCSENQKHLRNHLATHTAMVPEVLLPYVDRVLLPVLSTVPAPPGTAVEWRCLEAALQTFVVVTFNIGLLREQFRQSDVLPRVVAACDAGGLLGQVQWLDVIVRLSVNVDLTLSPWRADWRGRLLSAEAALPLKARAKVQASLTGGSAALPMSRSMGAAIADLAPLFGDSMVAAARSAGAFRPEEPVRPARQAKRAARGRSKGRKQHGRRSSRRRRPNFGMQGRASDAGVAGGDLWEAPSAVAGDDSEEDEGEGDEALPELPGEDAEAAAAGEVAAMAEAAAVPAAVEGGVHESLTCDLTGALLHEPVVTPEGGRYNREALEEWVANVGSTDPVSGAPLDLGECREDPALQQAVQDAQLESISTAALRDIGGDVVSAEDPRLQQAVQDAQLDPIAALGTATLQDIEGDHLSAQEVAGGAGAAPPPPRPRSGTRLLADLPPLQKAGDERKARGQKIRVKRSSVEGAPAHLRCAVDGKLMVDPLISPYGHVFERKTLERWVSSCGSVCPLTSQPLCLADCQPDVALRREVKAFLRQQQQQV